MSVGEVMNIAVLRDFTLHGEGGITVDFDRTLLVQAALVVLLIVVLKPLLFDPMMKLFEERENRIEGAIANSRKIDLKSAKAKAEYEQIMARERASANAERDHLRAIALKREQEILGQARAEAQKTLDDARRSLAKNVEEARGRLERETPIIAKNLASKVLGREIS